MRLYLLRLFNYDIIASFSFFSCSFSLCIQSLYSVDINTSYCIHVPLLQLEDQQISLLVFLLTEGGN